MFQVHATNRSNRIATVRRFINLLPTVATHYGYESFNVGLQRLGYERVDRVKGTTEGDLLLSWNRQGAIHVQALQFERLGGRVVVVENGYLGKHWRGAQWYAIALGHANGGGSWPDEGGARWQAWRVALDPWHPPTGETIVLGQRGIGEAGIRSPEDWLRIAAKHIATPARIRRHPGNAVEAKKAIPLELDLANASTVITWASAAGIRALLMGVPVFYGYPHWIGAKASRLLVDYKLGALCDDSLRLAMFERLAWALWTRAEVESGEALDLLLSNSR